MDRRFGRRPGWHELHAQPARRRTSRPRVPSSRGRRRSGVGIHPRSPAREPAPGRQALAQRARRPLVREARAVPGRSTESSRTSWWSRSCGSPTAPTSTTEGYIARRFSRSALSAARWARAAARAAARSLRAHGHDRLEVALQLRLRTARPDDDPPARARPVEQAVGRRQPVAALERQPLGQVERLDHLVAAEGRRRRRPQRRHRPLDQRQVRARARTAGRSRARRGSARGRRARRAASGRSPSAAAASSATTSAAVMPSLSRTRSGATQYPSASSYPKTRPGDPGDPLEPGQRHLVPHAVSGGDPGQQLRRHHRVRHDGTVGAGAPARAGAPRAARRPRRRAASASHRPRPDPGRRRRTGRRPGRWRSPGRHRARGPRPAPGRWRRAPRGSGTRPSGRRGPGSACCGTTYGAAKPARVSAATTVAPPTPCIGVSTTSRARGPPGQHHA